MVRLSYSCVKKEVANCCLTFKDFKRKKNLRLKYLKVKTTFNREIMYLVVKKQDAKYG